MKNLFSILAVLAIGFTSSCSALKTACEQGACEVGMDALIALTDANTAVTVIGSTAYVSSSNLTWMRCLQGQSYNALKDDCTGTGAPPSNGFKVYQFCDTTNESCNGFADGGALNGVGNSSLYNTCANLVQGNRTDWRVPTKDELKSMVDCGNGETIPLADNTKCGTARLSPTQNQTLFPDFLGGPVWTSTDATLDTPNAWVVSFLNGEAKKLLKPGNYAVRCVATGPNP